MNGVIEIKTESGIVKLRMNYYASMEFEQVFFKNPTTNTAKIFTDLIYSGLYGEAMVSGSQMPLYTDASKLVDEMSFNDDFDDVSLSIWNTYNESKWGKDFSKRIKDYTEANKKKVEEK